MISFEAILLTIMKLYFVIVMKTKLPHIFVWILMKYDFLWIYHQNCLDKFLLLNFQDCYALGWIWKKYPFYGNFFEFREQLYMLEIDIKELWSQAIHCHHTRKKLAVVHISCLPNITECWNFDFLVTCQNVNIRIKTSTEN